MPENKEQQKPVNRPYEPQQDVEKKESGGERKGEGSEEQRSDQSRRNP